MTHARRFFAHGPELGLALASISLTCLCLLVLELTARWADPGYFERLGGSSFDALHRYSEVYGWELRPGARERGDDGHWTTVNQHGYRGAPVPRAHQPGRLRVLMLGDSITFGTYVGDGEPFADLMHRPEQGVEVVNLAVQGFGLGQSLARYEREGHAFEPDVVVLNVCLANDFADTVLPVFLYDGRHPKLYYRLEGGRLVRHDEHLRLSARARTSLWLHERSQVYARVARALSPAAQEAAPVEHWSARRAAALRGQRRAIELAARVVAELRQEVEGSGARLVLALHPDKPNFRRASVWRRAFADSPLLGGVTVVDLADEYGARGLAFHDLVLDNLGHLSRYGHRRAAEILGAAVSGDATRLARLERPEA